MHGGWRIGRIAGVEVRLDPSLAFIAALLTFNLWVAFSDPRRFSAVGSGTAVLLAVLTAALFFGSVLAHELAHAGMARARGIRVLGITLYMLGGATHARLDEKGPADEFLVTVVGPVTSGAVGGLFLLLHAGLRGIAAQPATAMFGYLAVVNLVMAGFNLLPGFPLDGGRLLLAATWRITGSRDRATRIAARVGQAVAILIIAVAIFLWTRGNDLFALWPALIGLFLLRSAGAALAEGDRRKMLESTPAGRVMAAPPPTIPAGLSVGEAMERYLMGHEGEAFPVTSDGRVVGFVSIRTTRGVAPHLPVQYAMVGTDGTVEARPEEPMSVVIERIGAGEGRAVLVLEDGRLVGVIEPRDLERFLRRRPSSGTAWRRSGG